MVASKSSKQVIFPFQSQGKRARTGAGDRDYPAPRVGEIAHIWQQAAADAARQTA